MLRVICFLLLLIISQNSFSSSSVTAATATPVSTAATPTYTGGACSLHGGRIMAESDCYNDVVSYFKNDYRSSDWWHSVYVDVQRQVSVGVVRYLVNGTAIMNGQTEVMPFSSSDMFYNNYTTSYTCSAGTLSGSNCITNSYSCSSGYTLSDASGNVDSSGQYCVKVLTACEQKQSSSDYILGVGYFVRGVSSSVCYGGCSYTNSDSATYAATTLTYSDHSGVKHTCSVAAAAATYYTANGSDCSDSSSTKTVSTGTYSSMQDAYTACFADYIVADKAYESAKSGAASSATSTASSATSTDTTSDCAYGSSSGTFNGEKVTYCLSAPSSTATSATTANDDGSSTTTTTTQKSTTNSNGSVTTITYYHTVTTYSDGSSSSSDSQTSSTTAATSSGTGSAESQTSSECAEGEDGKVSCMDVGDVSALDSSSMASETKSVTYSADTRFGSSGGNCPFGDFTFNGHVFTEFEKVCDGVVLFKAIFLTICSIAAAYIVFGIRGGED